MSRSLIEKKSMPSATNQSRGLKASSIQWDTIHTALNICLFPPLFFFSGLYYTDVLSTCVVIAAYYVFLKREQNPGSLLGASGAFVVGILSLFMRQTNIFWVAVFLAGLEWIRACEALPLVERSEKETQQDEKNWFQRTIVPYSCGELHDPYLDQSSIIGIP
jgi:alpha-1,2-glucosyltransferase